MKADDHSLGRDQYQTVHGAAIKLLDRSGSWGRFPTPVDDVLSAAKLTLAPISAFDETAVQRYIRHAGVEAGRFLKKALDKVLGIFDVHADVIHIDESVNNEKQTFLKLHETGHKEIPHQSRLYQWIQDCSKHLSPEAADLFEREANTFASIVLFQDDTFSNITAEYEFGIKVPIKYSKKFGASVYASIREYVRHNHRACAVIVLEPTEYNKTLGVCAKVRRVQCSSNFDAKFKTFAPPQMLTALDELSKLIPLGKARMSKPAGFGLLDDRGDTHEFIGEGFATPYNTFILIHAVTTLSSKIFIPSIE
ncbi:protein of unknown function [Rhodoferax sp. OV413]|uniref:ImmA/IrrE family metallo-endopeptidase n=1 Tax=Rhodoferax sp. OV413 TaxID=1855285 RepID=UPI00087F5141|nr:ImmA/IrrE family metallo-endopeptidase [Rhodoferax sp. OV413]SDP90852.1 protein of unknown function [Rhodoferax sp. OV413]